RSSSSTRTICGDGAAFSLAMFANELLKAALWPSLDKIIASDFILQRSHYPVLQIQIEVHVDFAVACRIVPDRRRRCFGALPRLTQPTLRVALVEADDLLWVDRLARRFPVGVRPPTPPRPQPRHPPPPPPP